MDKKGDVLLVANKRRRVILLHNWGATEKKTRRWRWIRVKQQSNHKKEMRSFLLQGEKRIQKKRIKMIKLIHTLTFLLMAQFPPALFFSLNYCGKTTNYCLYLIWCRWRNYDDVFLWPENAPFHSHPRFDCSWMAELIDGLFVTIIKCLCESDWGHNDYINIIITLALSCNYDDPHYFTVDSFYGRSSHPLWVRLYCCHF